MPCRDNCEPSRPCYARGCTNAVPPADPPTNQDQPRPRRPRHDDQGDTPTVRLGVGYTSARDLDVEVHVDEVIRARRGAVELGVGNSARRDLRTRVVGNKVDSAEHVQLGVGNVADRDGYVRVSGNEFTGGGCRGVSIGVGNRAAGDLRMVISGNRWRPDDHDNDDGGGGDDDDRRDGWESYRAGPRGYAYTGGGEDRREYRRAWYRFRDRRRTF